MSDKVGFISPSRIWVIATNTFTQLVRMKVFYFLVVFAVIILALNFFELPGARSTASIAEQHLRVLKGSALFAMESFAVIFAIAATALLLPKDVEDRTLYTILCKPVPRLDYLFGKLLGVVLVIFVAVAIMDILMSVSLHFRMSGLVEEELVKTKTKLLRQGFTDEALINAELVKREANILAHGVTMNLQWGVIAVFFKAVVIAGVAILLSTFSSSTLFTIIVCAIVYFIGHFQSDARQLFLEGTEEHWKGFKMISKAIPIFFPDFQVYGISEAAKEATLIPRVMVVKLFLLTGMYSCVYVVLSWFVFRKKEF